VNALIGLSSLEKLSLQGVRIAPTDLLRLQAAFPSASLSISLAAESTPAPLQVGEMAPDFTVRMLDGKSFRLSDHRGKTVIVHFWATWCRPCIASAPGLKELEAELRQTNSRFAMISLSLDEHDTRVRQHVSKYGLTWPQAVIGPASKVREDYRIAGVPGFFVIGPGGRIESTSGDWAEIRAAVRTATRNGSAAHAGVQAAKTRIPHLTDAVQSTATQPQARGPELKSLLTVIPVLMLGLLVLGGVLVWRLHGNERGSPTPRAALVLALGGLPLGIVVALALGLVGINGAMFGYGAFLACEVPALALGWLSRQVSLGKTAMITAAVLMVVSLAFVG
jgi:peroxiredoxin